MVDLFFKVKVNLQTQEKRKVSHEIIKTIPRFSRQIFWFDMKPAGNRTT